jgi:hypothetical protein
LYSSIVRHTATTTVIQGINQSPSVSSPPNIANITTIPHLHTLQNTRHSSIRRFSSVCHFRKGLPLSAVIFVFAFTTHVIFIACWNNKKVVTEQLLRRSSNSNQGFSVASPQFIILASQ